MADATLRFLLAFSKTPPVSSWASDIVSQSMLVTTAVGRSLCRKALLVTICPAAWKERRDIGARSFQLISLDMVRIHTPAARSSLLLSETWLETTFVVTRMATANVTAAWKRKDVTRVPLRVEPSFLWKVLKQNAPSIKQIIDSKDFVQAKAGEDTG
ncbi:hypothetical protein EPUS_03216 [Endocarpon pusillum Z07020]|uniref:Uncharacterized protein n=1 Tax=Endocarpon pusillum (strain Z07020 / HMAS-L-300199) TaxID=1263415 RepID=U1GBB0_ENDPU|nr:uncharacterized protein EPUS_03216 [Endocarpon pusillum Z07020]ERF74832.1 hypothetical protein EPUS_03216 [Endocarpon pusillum Z07020]